MEELLVDNISTILDLGSLGATIYAIVILWRALKELERRKDEIIETKDEIMQKNREDVLEVVKENTKTQVELRASVKESTKATETLTAQLYRLFDGKEANR